MQLHHMINLAITRQDVPSVIAATLVFILVLIAIHFILRIPRESPLSEDARKLRDRVEERLNEMSPVLIATDPKAEVDYWILKLMADQLYQGLDSTTDLSAAAGVMAQAIPEIMLKKAAKNAKMTSEELSKRYYELKDKICQTSTTTANSATSSTRFRTCN